MIQRLYGNCKGDIFNIILFINICPNIDSLEVTGGYVNTVIRAEFEKTKIDQNYFFRNFCKFSKKIGAFFNFLVFLKN